MIAKEIPMEEAPRVFAPAVRWLSLAALGAMAMVVGHGYVDHTRRAALESYVASTGVGDRHLMPMPGAAEEASVTLALNGLPLRFTGAKVYEQKDYKMTYAAMDDGKQWRLYQSRDPLRGRHKEAEGTGPAYFVKHENGKYLRLQGEKK